MSVIAAKLQQSGRPVSSNPDDGIPDAYQKLPDGGRLDRLSASQLASALIDLKIPGASKSNSQEANHALYQVALQSVFHNAGMAAVKRWHRAGKSNQGAENVD